MDDCTRLGRLIPWHVNGTLDAGERRELEAHLELCPACSRIKETAELGSGQDDTLLDHVQVQHLERYVLERETLPEPLAGWIERHLDGCEVCRDAAASLASAAGRPASKVTPLLPRRPLLVRTLLHPVAAALYLAALLVTAPMWVGGERRAAAPSGGFVELPILSDALRGEDDGNVVRLGGDPVAIGVELELPFEASGSIGFEIVDADGAEVWSVDVPVERVERSLREAGIVTLLVPRSELRAGDFRMRVGPAGDAGSWLELPFEVSASRPPR